MTSANALNPSGNSNFSAVVQQRDQERSLCLSKIMTIPIGFHQQHYRTFNP
ncbi:MAG: hypothetical protein IGS54_25845 [Elainella sp. C42_A2020_010]|nr:hypothetical protein [Elainella sp. C42_A2020_010]